MKTLDIKYIRYLNLFERYSKVRTSHCFEYNSFVIFVVPPVLVSKAIGPGGENVKKLHNVINRKIKIIPMPKGIEDSERFILDIVEPSKFKSLEVKDNEIIITAGPSYKSSLIGRNKRRFLELREIVKSYFNKDLRII